MSLGGARGATLGDSGPPVAALQRGLLRLGYYGIRFGLDGHFGPNTLGAVLACKYDLVTEYGLAARAVGYAPVIRDRARLVASGETTADFLEAVETLLSGALLRGRDPWLLPTRDDVADADLDVRAFLAEEAAAPPAFPVQLFWGVLAAESGASHFDPFGHVKFGVDWQGRTSAQVANFTPDASWEPWVRSRGWGLSQYTPYRASALPRPMPAYILSVRSNIRAALGLFRGKFDRVTLRRPCSFPTIAAPRYDCRSCLRERLPDPAAYSDAVQWPCSWIKAVWAYNGLSPAGRMYAEGVVRTILG